jgi:hypothetical protein
MLSFLEFCLILLIIALSSFSVAVFAVTPPEKAGVVDSIFNCFEQVGSVAGSAIITSIQMSVVVTRRGMTSFFGKKVRLWFQFVMLVISTICLSIFMHNDIPPTKKAIGDTEKGLDAPVEKDLDIPVEGKGFDAPVEEKDSKMPVNEEDR